MIGGIGGTRDDNYAFAGMIGGDSDKTARGLDGADVSAARATYPAFWKNDVHFDESVWVLQNGKLPILKGIAGQDGTPGFYLTNTTTYTLAVSAQNGTVTGGGTYAPYDSVTITATPAAGYAFDTWMGAGVTFANANAATTTFVMPERNVTITATFKQSGNTSGNNSNNNGNDGTSSSTAQSPPTNTPAHTTTQSPTSTSAPSPTVTPNAPKVTTSSTGSDSIIKVDATVSGIPFTQTYGSSRPVIKQAVHGDSTTMVYKMVNGKLIPVILSGYDGKNIRFIADGYGDYMLRNVGVPRFGDVDYHDWYADAVDFCVAHGLVIGIGDNAFDPYGNMTIGQFAVLLSRIAGEDISPADGEEWYAPYMDWLYDSKLISSELDGGKPITRELIAYMLSGMSQFTKVQTGKVPLDKFNDADGISDWAKDAISRIVSAGVIMGDDKGNLNPTAYATRSEVATMIMRYIMYALK